MNEIKYKAITKENFNDTSLDNFKRHQDVKESWRHTENGLVLVPNAYTEDWDMNKLRNEAAELLEYSADGKPVFAAFLDGEVVGYVQMKNELFGSEKQYVELYGFQVSEPYRGRGIGKQLFALAKESARKLGAKKLYISAHSSKESQACYRKLGCVEAVEVNRQCAENEPFDVQMECDI